MTFIVPAVLGGLALSVMALVSLAAARRGRHPAQPQLPQMQPRILIHSINDDRCTGCDACVAVCPTNVLDLVDNKSRVLRFQDCIQCEACMWACPTEALVMHLEGTEPPPLKVPDIDEFFQTAIPGQYLIGEVAGKPLVKNAANLGRAVVEHMVAGGLQSMGPAAGNQVDVAIVGSGPGGLSAAFTCISRGLSYVVLEKEQLIASTVARYPKGKLVMAEPYDTRNLSLLPVFDSSKEQIVPLWEDLLRRTQLNLRMGEGVERVSPRGDGFFDVHTTVGSYLAQRVVLATGTRGKPRTLGVPGENLPKVFSLLDDPDPFRNLPVLVIGGGDSAVEAAIALADAGAHVILSYRGRAFSRAQPKIKQTIESYAAQRRLKIKYMSQVMQLTDDAVVIQQADGQQKRYPNAAAFVLIGSDPPITWLEQLGIHFVDRPHSHRFGKTDDLIMRLVGNAVIDCPEDAHSAATLILEGRLPDRAMAGVAAAVAIPAAPAQSAKDELVIAASGPRKWLRSATAIFSSGRKEEKQPIPLSEFARSQRKHTGDGRRDQLDPSERTRILRMLRDEGGRIADEESRVDIVAPPPAPQPIDPSSEDSEPYYGTSGHAAAPPPRRAGARPRSQAGATSLAGARGPAIPRLFGGLDGPAPKPAVIVGLAQAKEKAKHPGRTLMGRRNPESRAPGAAPPDARAAAYPPSMSGARRPVAPSPSFDREATRQIDSDAALAQLLRDSARDDSAGHGDSRRRSPRQSRPPSVLDPSALVVDAEEPTMHVDVSSGGLGGMGGMGGLPHDLAAPGLARDHDPAYAPAYDDDLAGLDGLDEGDSFMASDDATRAMDMTGLARRDAYEHADAVLDEYPGDEPDEPTHAIDIGDSRSRELGPRALSDVDWDLD